MTKDVTLLFDDLQKDSVNKLIKNYEGFPGKINTWVGTIPKEVLDFLISNDMITHYLDHENF